MKSVKPPTVPPSRLGLPRGTPRTLETAELMGHVKDASGVCPEVAVAAEVALDALVSDAGVDPQAHATNSGATIRRGNTHRVRKVSFNMK